MAANQVIHGSNRVVENPNRYKLNAVSGQANTYDLEKVPGVIIDNGTPYSKTILDKIDNILSYLTPSVEKVGEVIQETKTFAGNIIPTDITPTWTTSSTTKETQNVVMNCTTFDGITPKIEISTNIGGWYRNTISYQRVICFIPTSYSSSDFKSETFKSLASYTSKLANYYNRFGFYENGNYQVYYTYDFTVPVKIKFKLHLGESQGGTGNVIFQASNDNTNWLDIQTITFNIENNISSATPYRYYRILMKNNIAYEGETSYYIYYAYPYEVEYIKTSTIFKNQFTLDNNGNTFTNNQRVLVEIPSTTDTTDVTSNTLNGIEVTSLLQPSSKYELVYNENEEKFKLGCTLFDITLTEAVNQIDLTGIANMLDVGKIYSLNILGKLSANDNIYFGSYTFLQGYTSLVLSPFIFMVFIVNNKKTVQGIKANTSLQYNNGTITNNEFIKCSNTSTTFSAGTRIIIKEVC